MILEAGGIGIYDWGLVGVLSKTDREIIVRLLRALMSLNPERLVDELLISAKSADPSTKITREAIKKEVDRAVNAKKRGFQPESIHQLLDICLRTSDRLGIVIPSGLLMMVKTLVTLEAVAKGVDHNVKISRIAMPLLLRFAKPGLRDIFSLAKNLKKVW